MKATLLLSIEMRERFCLLDSHANFWQYNQVSSFFSLGKIFIKDSLMLPKMTQKIWPFIQCLMVTRDVTLAMLKEARWSLGLF